MTWTGQDITEQRKQFVVRATSRNGPFKEICGFFGISRTTGYKWVSRYEELGNLRDLKERSRRPHQVPNKTTPDIEGNVLALRDHAGWGARRLAAALRQQTIQILQAGYRYMDVNYRQRSGAFIYDVAQSDLVLGATWNVK